MKKKITLLLFLLSALMTLSGCTITIMGTTVDNVSTVPMVILVLSFTTLTVSTWSFIISLVVSIVKKIPGAKKVMKISAITWIVSLLVIVGISFVILGGA